MSPEIVKLLLQGVEETIFMVAVSGIIATVIGIPLGILLVTTDKGHILENAPINRVFGTIVNIIRSVPFIILMVAIIPFTKLVAGTSIGTLAACVPLTIVAIPFLSRLVETSVRDIDYGLIEAAQSMGATPFQIIQHYGSYRQPYRFFRHGRCRRRRRFGGHCHSLRLPAIPYGRHVGDYCHLNHRRQRHSGLRRFPFS